LRNSLRCILLLSCLAAPLLLGYGWLRYQKSVVRKTVKRQLIAGLKPDELVLLKFTPEEARTALHWEHSREFEYQGQMFDVVKTETRGDTIFYYCWWDHAETELNQKIQALVANALHNNPQHQDNQARLSCFFKSLFCIELPFWQMLEVAPEAPPSPPCVPPVAPPGAPLVPPPEFV
jgi:hypothetical protein